MIINIPFSQTYKCIDRALFEKELFEKNKIFFFKKQTKFVNSDGTIKERDIFVSDNSIEYIQLFNDGIREAEVFFKERHPEIIEDRQRNNIFIDVKYLPEQDLVVIGNKHYDLTNDFSTFQILRIEKNIKINLEKNPEDLFKIIKKKYNKITNEAIDFSNQIYSYNNNLLSVSNKRIKITEKDIIKTSQYEIFIYEDKCLICMLKNKLA